jgi:hypothetical protein
MIDFVAKALGRLRLRPRPRHRRARPVVGVEDDPDRAPAPNRPSSKANERAGVMPPSWFQVGRRTFRGCNGFLMLVALKACS